MHTSQPITSRILSWSAVSELWQTTSGEQTQVSVAGNAHLSLYNHGSQSVSCFRGTIVQLIGGNAVGKHFVNDPSSLVVEALKGKQTPGVTHKSASLTVQSRRTGLSKSQIVSRCKKQGFL